MNKKLLALAVLAVAGTASAQSSLTLFGIADVNFQRATQGGISVLRLVGNGSGNSSRLGFRGVEDLGGGMSASFWLEAGLNIDNGTGAGSNTNNQASGSGPSPAGTQGLMFNRRSTVSLASPMGELRLGRDYTPAFYNLAIFDPFNAAGAGNALNINLASSLNQTAPTATAARASNAVSYLLPPLLGGVYGQVMYALGENASSAPAGTSSDGRYAGARLGYANGPLDLAAAWGKTTLASGDVSAGNIGASYGFGFGKVSGQLFRDRKDVSVSNAANASRGFLLGASFIAGPGTIPVSYATVKDNSNAVTGSNKASQLAIGYVYNLSKRSAIYTTYSQITNKNRAAVTGGGVPGVAGAKWTGLDVGVRHSF